jgi:hypothetical protein
MFKDRVDSAGYSSLTNANTPLYFATSTAIRIANTTQIQQTLDYFAVILPNCGFNINLRCSALGASLPTCFPQQWSSVSCAGTVFFRLFTKILCDSTYKISTYIYSAASFHLAS